MVEDLSVEKRTCGFVVSTSFLHDRCAAGPTEGPELQAHICADREEVKMRLRKIALALFACLALAAVAANVAQADWTITTASGLKEIKNGESEKVKCAKHGTEPLQLVGTAGTLTVTLVAEGIDCEEAVINALATEMNTDHSEGFLNFTNVKVTSNEKCKVKGGSLTTKKLTDQLYMDEKSGSTAVMDRFFPETGTTFVEITFEGSECPINELTVPVTGASCGESVHTSGTSVVASKTGEHNINNILAFGAAQEETGNSTTFPCGLKLGTKTATISGTVSNELAGENAGKAWGAD
jgi:hypothetical protein